MRNIRIILFLIMLMVFSFLTAQNTVILEIKVVGNTHISNELILSSLGMKAGDFYAQDKMSEAIKNLYKLNVFDDIEILDTQSEKGIFIEVKVKELPMIKKFKYIGGKVLKKDKLEEIGIIRIGSYWSDVNQSENTRKILSEYKTKGYTQVQISYDVTISKDNEAEIDVNITEGKKIVVKKINITGNQQIPAKKLLSKIKTKTKGLFRSGTFEDDKFDEDQNEIINYYKKLGYMDARIVNVEKNIISNRYYEINIQVEEGIKYYFGSVNIEGNSRFTSEELLKNFTFKEAEIFDMEKFNKQLSKVSSMYYEEGYIYSSFNPEVVKDSNKVNIKLMVEENNRAKVHKIFISGNRKTKEKVIRRNLDIAPGDYFRQSAVIKSQQNVYNLGFFEPDMKLDYQPINKDGDIDLYLNLTDKSVGQANGGVGYNSRDGVIGQFSLAHRNILGNYWTGSLKWEFGGSIQNVELDFSNPYFYDTNVLAGFNLYHTRKDWDSFNYQIYTNGGGVSLGYPLKFIDYSRIIGKYSFYAKKYKIIDFDDSYSDNLADLDSTGWQNTSSFNFTISRDSRDNVFYPGSGSRIALYSELAGGIFGGDFNYFKQIAEVSWYTTTFWKLVLRTKWRIGYVTEYGSGKQVPPDERFYLGGVGTDGLRGYGERSIGPVDGGKREVLFSTEYTVPISSDQIIGLLFLDAGNCFNKFESFNFWNLKKGAGLGTRIQSPFGLIGFDYAYNFEEKTWEPHFQFGTNF